MTNTWDEAKLLQYITDGIEESLNLDYKAAASLDRKGNKKKEITKDVSAMANSEGGIIIYGIAEYQDKENSHLPEKLDPVDRTQFSKEWLEHIINTISPKIDGVRIYPVNLSSGSNDVAYVVDIPQSNTAHQARDYRYYMRYNFESVPMEDYYVRDVMGRGQHPKIELEFEFLLSTSIFERDNEVIRQMTDTYLRVSAVNRGSVYANYVNAYFTIPKYILPIPERLFGEQPSAEDYYTVELRQEHETKYEDNTVREVIGTESIGMSIQARYGSARYDPILPERWHRWFIDVRKDIRTTNLTDLVLDWAVFADNTPKLIGKRFLTDIEFIEEIDER